MSIFTRAQAREVAKLNAEAAALIAADAWDSAAFRRLRDEIRKVAPDFGDAQSQLIRYARPEWIANLDVILASNQSVSARGDGAHPAADRLNALRRRDAEGTLSEEERHELEGLIARLDGEDRALLEGDGERQLLEAVRDAERLRASPDVSASVLEGCRARLEIATEQAIERARRYAHELAA